MGDDDPRQYLSDEDSEVGQEDQGSKPRLASVQGVPTQGVVDTGERNYSRG